MNIIKCNMSHLDMVADMYDDVTAYLEANVNYPKWTPGVYPGRESTKTAISEAVQYVYLDGGRAAGAFILNENPQGDYSAGEWGIDIDEGEYLVIHTLAVSPEAYNKGIGQLMVKYCIEYAKNNGYKAVRVDVVPDNFPARRLYEKMGFVFAGEKDLKRNIEAIPQFALYEYICD